MSDDKSGDTFTYTLQRPVTVKNTAYEMLTVRRPLVRDLIAADRQPGKVAADAALMSICANVPLADFGHFDAADFRALQEEADERGFFGGSATTSGDSSSSSTAQPAGDSPTS